MTSRDLPKQREGKITRRTLLMVTLGVFLVAGLAYFLVNRYYPQLWDWEGVDAQALEAFKQTERKSVSVQGDNWLQFLGPQRNGVAPEGPIRTDWGTNPPRAVWQTEVGGGFSSFALEGNELYTLARNNDDERLLCLDRTTGNLIWEVTYPGEYKSENVGYPSGPRATPTIVEDHIYVVGTHGQFLAYQLQEDRRQPPKKLWQHRLTDEFQAPMPQWGFASSPLIVDQLVIVQAGGKKGSVVAFDRVSGELRWAAGSDKNGYSSPIVATLAGIKQIVAMTGENLLGLSLSGDILWTFPWKTSFQGNIATPLAFDDYLFISSAYSKGCALLHIEKSGDTCRCQRVYFTRGRMNNHHSTSVEKEGYIYGFHDNELRCVNLADPEADYEWRTEEVVKGSVIRLKDVLIGLSQNGELFLCAADPKSFQLLGKVSGQLHGTECWALPVYLSGKIYVRDSAKVICFDVQ